MPDKMTQREYDVMKKHVFKYNKIAFGNRLKRMRVLMNKMEDELKEFSEFQREQIEGIKPCSTISLALEMMRGVLDASIIAYESDKYFKYI